MKLFMITWLIVGLISLIGIWMVEIKLNDFKIKDLSYEHITVSILMILLGYISPLIVCAAIANEQDEWN